VFYVHFRAWCGTSSRSELLVLTLTGFVEVREGRKWGRIRIERLECNSDPILWSRTNNLLHLTRPFPASAEVMFLYLKNGVRPWWHGYCSVYATAYIQSFCADHQICSKPWVSKFIWHRTTPIFVGWLAGRTWKNNNKWYTYCLNYCAIFKIYTQFTNLGANRIRHTASGPRVGEQHPKSSQYFIKQYEWPVAERVTLCYMIHPQTFNLSS
jgi:hypothetical protein